MFQILRPAKIKFATDLKRKRRASSPTSTSSDSTNPKRSATPAGDSPLAQLHNDVGIQALVREVGDDELFQICKEFFFCLQGLKNNNSLKESAKYIYDEARKIWGYKEPSLSDKLIYYSNNDEPAQRLTAMMNDPWLKNILGDTDTGLKQSDDAITSGILSILVAYYNMRDIIDKYKLGEYGRKRTPTSACITPISKVIGRVAYVMDHPHDFRSLRKVLEAKYGSDPDLVASLFEQISNSQDRMNRYASYSSTTGKRAMFEVKLRSDGSSPSSPITIGNFFFHKIF
ncbi:hypothetical protein CASFOL_039416 [Castilleja foliolosa]|uniref:Uncharacterized protein n=1 Tax=Castilleja foliolosa TaxID=1961234 RepID=A0ABD3BIB0_9LAMI